MTGLVICWKMPTQMITQWNIGTVIFYYYYYFVSIWIARSLDHHFGWDLHFDVFRLLSPYLVCSWSFFIIFIILLDVSLRSVWSLQNISVLFTYVVLFVWIPLHSSSICSCVSVFAVFTAGYVVLFTSVVVFYVQHPCLCLKYGRRFHSS